MPIRVLPSLLVNQIAAGEVVERPANVVKELVENSLDAGATRIEVETEGGGRELIRVSDDGAGIAAEELALAIAPHATSKIAAVEDLACVRSMGFRGEALASIASVSRLRLLSRPRGGEVGAGLEVEGGDAGPVRPAPAPPGTTLWVRNLFFNVPARRRFLRGEQAEAGRIAETMAALALAHPSVGFRLVQNGRAGLDVPPGQSRRERVVAILGRELEGQLLEFSGDEPGGWLKVWGMAGTPATARATARHLRIAVNGRVVADRTVLHAVREAYRGLLDPARHPTAAVFLEIDPVEVDVNVHPTKAEVRFRSGGAVHQAVRRAIRAALRAADLVPEAALPQAPWHERALPGAGASSAAGHFGSIAPFRTTATRTEAARGGDPASASAEPQTASARDASPATWLGPWPLPAPVAASERPRPTEEAMLPVPVAPVAILQAHRKYLVVEDPQGLLVVDQHALHERAMYESIMGRLGEGPLESQSLLVPAVLPAEPSRLEILEEIAPLLSTLGIDAGASGPASVSIHAFPSLLLARGVEPPEFLGELLDRVVAGDLPREREVALEAVVSMMACKAAVKSGDRLRPEELADLLRRREELERGSACPHGRPTAVRITLRELDRWFARG